MDVQVSRMSGPAADGARAARRHASGSTAGTVARIGLIARGVVYLIVGGLTLMAAIGASGAVADKNTAIAAVGQQPLGTVSLILVAIGLLAYALWRLVRAAFDPEHTAEGTKGAFTRLGY